MAARHEELTVGTQVRVVNNPSRTGVIVDDKPRIRAGRRLYKVQFPDTVDHIFEENLEKQPKLRVGPLDLLEDGDLGTPSDLRRALIHARVDGRLADTIYSIESTNTTFYAYQFKPVMKILQTPANGILIADEVGLGKTIEAGLIWTELRVRFNFNRLFVVCPAALREKWRDELAVKIGVDAQVRSLPEAYETLCDKASSRRGFALVCSMQGLRTRRGVNSRTNKSKEFEQFLEDMENEEDLIDVLIVDEAHYMRNSDTATHRLGQRLRGVSTYVILLSATPVHNHSADLFSLLRLIDGDMFAKKEYLGQILQANQPLIEARDNLLTGNPSHTKIAMALDRAKRNDLLSNSKQLDTLISQFKSSDITHIPTRLRLANKIETINLLSHTVTRTRKREVLENRVIREPIAELVSMTRTEKEFYDMVTEIVANYAFSQGLNESFLQVTPQQQMVSCMSAALVSWQDRHTFESSGGIGESVADALPGEEQFMAEASRLLGFDIDDEELLAGAAYDSMQSESDDWMADPNHDEIELGPLISELVVHSKELCTFQDLQDCDSKYKRVKEILTEFFSKRIGEKIIIFSTFRATIAYLSMRLGADGMSTIVLRGGDRRDKYDILREFESTDGPQVLLSTEIGGEGIDLQFCWAIINYDLPWNPMRIEQRIGRIDRLGQASPKVLIWNLLYDDTIDSRIYSRLYEKLDLCRRSLGDFEPIVGEAVGKLSRELLTSHLTPKQQEERIAQTAIALEEQRVQEERLERNAANLVAYGEYILKEVYAARDLQRWISSADLRFYVTSLLDTYFPGYKLRPHDIQDDEFELLLPRNARHELWRFIKKNGLRGKTILNQSVTPVSVKFRNSSSSNVIGDPEVISQSHPLFQFAIEKFKQSNTDVRPATAVKISASDAPDLCRIGTYLLGISLWSVQGVRRQERLAYEALEIRDSAQFVGSKLAEILMHASVTKGRYWQEVHSECELSSLLEIANSKLFSELELRYREFVASEEALNWDRSEVLQKNLVRRFMRQYTVLSDTLSNYEKTGKKNLIPPTKGRLRSLTERFRDQNKQIEEQRAVMHWSRDVAIAVVRVE